MDSPHPLDFRFLGHGFQQGPGCQPRDGSAATTTAASTSLLPVFDDSQGDRFNGTGGGQLNRSRLSGQEGS